jgi:hypothetical protein
MAPLVRVLRRPQYTVVSDPGSGWRGRVQVGDDLTVEAQRLSPVPQMLGSPLTGQYPYQPAS